MTDILSSEIGILVTSWPGHTKIPGGLQRCVDSLKDVKYRVLLGCDTHNEDFGIDLPDNIGFFITGRNQAELPDDFKTHQGEHLQLRAGTEWFLETHKYLFIFEGDMFFKGKSLEPLIVALGDHDFLTWPMKEEWRFGIWANFVKTRLFYDVVHQGPNIASTVEDTYARWAKKLGHRWLAMPSEFWHWYVGGRCFQE